MNKTVNQDGERMVVCVRFCHAHTFTQSTKANWQN